MVSNSRVWCFLQESMGSTFNPQILVDKLSKLNSSQQSIETLSHWCIFHMNKAKQVVETWDRQFYCAPREQRLAFLYLANDILQNSRRKGAEFVAEFWKVLPDSLRDVIENGDGFGRNAALRLINIWEERKVFGSRGQILKEEFVKKQLDNGNKNWKRDGPKLQRSPGGIAIDKLISGYEAVYGNQVEEDSLFNKCTDVISFLEKVDKDIGGDYRLEELKERHAVLRDCIEQLAVVESSRANLVLLLREALQEQEYKLGQVRDQLQAAQTQSEHDVSRQLLGGSDSRQVHGEDSGAGNRSALMSDNFISGAGEQTTPVIYTRQESGHIEEDPKSAAAAMAAKLAASASSAQMLTFVLSSLASEGVIGKNPSIKEPPNEYSSEKRAKIESEHPSYMPPQITQAPVQPTQTVASQELNPSEPNPGPHLSSPPPNNLQPLQPPMLQYPMPPQYLQAAMPLLSGGPYGYGMSQQMPAPPHGNYVSVGHLPAVAAAEFSPPSNGSYPQLPPPPPEDGLYCQPSSMPMAPANNQ
ncbi:UPF0400 protein C337.03 isoform X4 [Andrographis paniculata]|uniref:UPF0400 protein C337.03 isoform X4 n=1 Tax=Andrographis paniculata TaxID=175694 RepID=UPI0021E8962D|nr:UPF0400 protein C337.03 isoform X4 [Andrographis paniculata]